MASCAGASSGYLQLLNGIVLLCALGVLAGGAFLASKFSDLKDAVSQFVVVAPAVLGGVLLVVAVIGIVGARRRNKCLLLIYIAFTTAVTIFVFGCGAALLAYGGALDKVRDGQVTSTIEANVQDFELAVYTKCCVDQFQGLTAAQACADNGNQDPCITNQGNFNDFVDNIPAAGCTQLDGFKVFGTVLVGDPAVDGGCGGGDPGAFVVAISQFVHDNIRPIASANLILAIVMLLDLIASCVLLCSRKDLYEEKEKMHKQESDV